MLFIDKHVDVHVHLWVIVRLPVSDWQVDLRVINRQIIIIIIIIKYIYIAQDRENLQMRWVTVTSGTGAFQVCFWTLPVWCLEYEV